MILDLDTRDSKEKAQSFGGRIPKKRTLLKKMNYHNHKKKIISIWIDIKDPFCEEVKISLATTLLYTQFTVLNITDILKNFVTKCMYTIHECCNHILCVKT